jgi:hypothetical protein
MNITKGYSGEENVCRRINFYFNHKENYF